MYLVLVFAKLALVNVRVLALNRESISRETRMRFVGLLATGYNQVDKSANLSHLMRFVANFIQSITSSRFQRLPCLLMYFGLSVWYLILFT